MKRLATLALIGGLLAIHPGTAQEPKAAAKAPPAKPQRALYAVRNADPAAVAEALTALFGREAVVAAAPGAARAVLVSGSAEAVAEAGKLVEQLDRKPRAVEVEVTIVEAAVAKDGKEPAAAELLKDGKGQRIKLTAVEGQPVTSMTGGNRPFATQTRERPAGGGANPGGGGGFGGRGEAAPPRAVRSIDYSAIGTTVKLTARVEAGDAVAVDLSVQETKAKPDEESGATAFDNGTLTAKVRVPAGKPVVAQTVRTDGKAGTTVAMVIVTARVVDDAATAAGGH
jgi:hypothetical protein